MWNWQFVKVDSSSLINGPACQDPILVLSRYKLPGDMIQVATVDITNTLLTPV